MENTIPVMFQTTKQFEEAGTLSEAAFHQFHFEFAFSVGMHHVGSLRFAVEPQEVRDVFRNPTEITCFDLNNSSHMVHVWYIVLYLHLGDFRAKGSTYSIH